MVNREVDDDMLPGVRIVLLASFLPALSGVWSIFISNVGDTVRSRR